jgi:hypothetical protein
MCYCNRFNGYAVKGFGAYEIIFMNVCVIVTVSMVMPLRDLGLMR